MRRAWVFILLLGAANPALAGEFLTETVSTEDGTYYLNVTAILHAPYLPVYSMLTSYENRADFCPDITESTLLEQHLQSAVVRTVIEDCVAFYCQKIINTEQVTEPEPGHIEAKTIPEKSNLRYGRARWRIFPVEGGTEVIMSAAFQPAFWVPPLIGPSVIRARLQAQAEAAINNIERLSIERLGAGY